jgi:hypothetical protein
MEGTRATSRYYFPGLFDTDSVIEVIDIQEPNRWSASLAPDEESEIRDSDFELSKAEIWESEDQTTQ